MHKFIKGMIFAASVGILPSVGFAACGMSGAANTGDLIISMKGVSGVNPGFGRVTSGLIGDEGDIIFNRANDRLMVCDGTIWRLPDGSEMTSASAGVPGVNSAPTGMTLEIVSTDNTTWKPRYTGKVEFVAIGGGGSGATNVTYGGSAGAVCHKTLEITSTSASFKLDVGGVGTATKITGPGISMTAAGGQVGSNTTPQGGDCTGDDWGFKGGNGKSGDKEGGHAQFGYRNWNISTSATAVPPEYVYATPGSIMPFTGDARIGSGGYGKSNFDSRNTIRGNTGSGGGSAPNGGWQYRQGDETYQVGPGSGGAGVIWVLYYP
jgi:hypothetical protein